MLLQMTGFPSFMYISVSFASDSLPLSHLGSLYICRYTHTHTHTTRHSPYLFIHQQTCCCHVLFIGNNTIMNMKLQASLKDTDFIFEYILLSEIIAI